MKTHSPQPYFSIKNTPPSRTPVKFNQDLSLTPPETRFMPPVVIRSISPTIHSQHSRSNSPYVIQSNIVNGPLTLTNRSNQNMSTNPLKQRIFNISNVPRENRHKEEMNFELEKVRQKNHSLTKKLHILEEIVGNSGLELMEQKIAKLLNENKRLASILQENKMVSNQASPVREEKEKEKGMEINSELYKEVERLRKIIHSQNADIEVWKKRWSEAESNSLSSNNQELNRLEKEKLSLLLSEKNEEVEKMSKKIKQLTEISERKEFENNKKISILLQENDKLNVILNSQIDELDKLAFKYQDIEMKFKKNSMYESQCSVLQNELAESNSKIKHLFEENRFLMEKAKQQEKDIASIGVLEQKIEMVVEENIKNTNLLKLKMEECDFYKKKSEEGNFNMDFLENENVEQKQIIEELKSKINILIEENKKLNEMVALKIGENVVLSALEEKIEILMNENRKLNELNSKIQHQNRPDEAIIYKEKAVFLEKKNLVLMDEVEKLKQDLEKNIADNQQIGEIEMKTELLIEENSNLNNLLAEKDEEIFNLKSKLMQMGNGVEEEENY